MSQSNAIKVVSLDVNSIDRMGEAEFEAMLENLDIESLSDDLIKKFVSVAFDGLNLTGNLGIENLRTISRRSSLFANSGKHNQIRTIGRGAVASNLNISKQALQGEKGILGFHNAHGSIPTYKLRLTSGANWHKRYTNDYLPFVGGINATDKEKEINKEIGSDVKWARKSANITSADSYKDNRTMADYLSKLISKLDGRIGKLCGVDDSEKNKIEFTLIKPDKKSANGVTIKTVTFGAWKNLVAEMAKRFLSNAKKAESAEAEAEKEIEGNILTDKETIAETKAQMLSTSIEATLIKWKELLLSQPELGVTEFGLSMDNLSKAVKSV